MVFFLLPVNATEIITTTDNSNILIVQEQVKASVSNTEETTQFNENINSNRSESNELESNVDKIGIAVIKWILTVGLSGSIVTVMVLWWNAKNNKDKQTVEELEPEIQQEIFGSTEAKGYQSKSNLYINTFNAERENKTTNPQPQSNTKQSIKSQGKTEGYQSLGDMYIDISNKEDDSKK